MIKFLLTFILTSFLLHGNTQENVMKEGKKFGAAGSYVGLEQAKNNFSDELKPIQDTATSFNADDAKKRLLEQDIPHSEVREFISSDNILKNRNENRLFDENEYLFKKSEELTKNNSNESSEKFVDEVLEYIEETCVEPEVPFSLSSERSLVVEVNHQPAVKKIVKICSKHESTEHHFWKSDAEKEKKKQEKKLSSDPSIKNYKVSISGGGGLSDFVVKSTWKHFDDASSCKAFKKKRKKIKEESWEESDRWLIQNDEIERLAKTLQCTFIGKECLDSTPKKTINEKEVERKCWFEKWFYKCRYEDSKQCEFLKSKNCILIQKKCIQNEPQGCALWQKVFKCISKIAPHKSELNNGDIYGIDIQDWDDSYHSNTAFVQVSTTLSVFDAIKKELEIAQALDASHLQLFKGKDHKCSKSVAEDLMYDCCFAYGGLAKELKVSQCINDELMLADLREKGLCHYIGSYEEKFIELWTSRTEHVFCCFPTKLGRIFQEKAREQLGIGWGTPKHPDCRGLTCQEISQLDFSKIDLSEAFEKITGDNSIDERIKSLEKKLKDRTDEKEYSDV